MNNILRLFALWALFPAYLTAQCPVVLQCPSQPDTICDNTNNDSFFWNESYWWDPVHARHDLTDAPADLFIRALDTCGAAGLNISYTLRFDLDGDDIFETAVWSDSLNPANTIWFNNLQIPGGTAHAFDGRPVPDNEKYQFALEMTTSGDTATARVRWTTEAGPGVYVDPQLPAGLYLLRWKIETPDGVEAYCNRQFRIRDCPLVLHACVRKYCDNAGLDEVVMRVQGSHPALPPLTLFVLTDNNGCIDIGTAGLPFIGSYNLSPFKDGLVSATPADAERVRRHLNGTEPFTSPYEWVAADVNNDSVVDSLDVTEIEKVAAGILTVWTSNTTWRFIPKDYLFPQPSPLSDPVPSSMPIDLAGPNLDFDFVAVRVGDLDLCGITGVSAVPEGVTIGNPQPNPTTAGVTIPVQLTQNQEIRLEIFDLQGRQIYNGIYRLPAGSSFITVPGSVFSGTGMYGWRVWIAGMTVAQGKVICH